MKNITDYNTKQLYLWLRYLSSKNNKIFKYRQPNMQLNLHALDSYQLLIKQQLQ